MATGVLVLGLERVGEAEQALQHGTLHLPVALPEIHGIREGLLIGSPQLVVRAVGLLFSGPRDLVERPEVSRVREGLGQRYIGRHDRVSGTRASTSARRAKGENGLVRYSSAPAARPRARSDSWPAAVSMTMGCARATALSGAAGRPRSRRAWACARRAGRDREWFAGLPRALRRRRRPRRR